MANIMFGVAVAAASGSVGGTTFSRGAGGAIMRNRSRPINPRSSLQNTRRANMAYLTKYWSGTLTEQQRSDWRAYAAGTSWTNKLGQSISNSGISAFLRLNALRAIMDLTPNAAAPLAMGHAGGITQGFLAENDTSKLQMDEPGGAFDKDLDGDYVLWFAGLPVEAGRVTGFKGMRFVGFVEGDSVAAPSFPDEQTAPYTMAAGQNVTVKAIHIDPESRVSSPVYSTVTAAPSI